MTPAQFARQVGCSVSTIKAWISTGKLKAVAKTSESGQKYWWIRPNSLRAFLKRPRKVQRGFPLGRKRKANERET